MQIKQVPDYSLVRKGLWKCGVFLFLITVSFWLPFPDNSMHWFFYVPRLLMMALVLAFLVVFLSAIFLVQNSYTLTTSELICREQIMGFKVGETRLHRSEIHEVIEKEEIDPNLPKSIVISAGSDQEPFESIPLTEAQCEWLLPIIKSWLEDSSGLIHPDDEDHR